MNKLTILQAFSIFFLYFLITSPLSSQTATASFSTWKDNKKAAYSIIHDDYSNYVTGIFQYADPIATAHGIKLCFGAITNFCGPTEWANARTMIAHGHECVNHSHNHKCGGSASECSGLSTYNAAQFSTELGLSTQLIETNTGVKPRFFIHPYDAASTPIINYLSGLGYLGTRDGVRSTVNLSSFTDFMHLNYFVYTPNSQISLLNQAVDQAIASSGYTIREFHGIEDGSWANMTIANYTNHLDYVKTQMDNGNIWSATTTEAITYKMQRDAFQPLAAYTASLNRITVSFNETKALDTLVLRTPITLNVNLNGIAGNYNVTQNGVSIPSVRNGNIVTVNIYPHKGNVLLNCTNCDPCATDIIKPVLTACPTNISLTTRGTTAVATWTAPTATDNCSIPIVSFATSPITGLTNGDAFPIGTTTVTYTATDAKNNTATCSFNVFVTQTDPCATDIIKPVLTACPTNISLTTSGTTAVATWTAPTATDNCSIPIVSFATSPTTGLTNGDAFPIGTTTGTYTATDAKNNTATCSFAVTITQQSTGGDVCTQPTAHIVGASNAINITGITTSSAHIQVFSSFWQPVYSEQVNTTTTTVPNMLAGSYNVKVTVLGAGGRWPSICEVIQNVTVTSGQNSCTTDVTPPILTACPSTINLTTGTTTAIATWTAPTATDDCSTPSVSFTTHPTTGLTNGSAFPIGITTVTYTATDAKNNTTTCAFNIMVTQSSTCTTDNIPPVLTACPGNMNLTTATTSATATWTAPTATDNCSTPSVSFVTSPTAGLTNGSAFPIGTNTVTYTATDAKNNTTTCRFTITVTQQTTGADICAQPAANIVGASNTIIINGITTASAHIQVFTNTWVGVLTQLTNTTTVTIPNLAAGGYIVKISVLGAGGKWPAICNIQQNVMVGSILASQSQAILALEAHAEPTRSVIEWVNNTGNINDYFTVEKADNKTGVFESLKIVNNKSFDKDMTHYVAYDETPNEGDNSYRITLMHNDGSTKVSGIKTVQFKGLYTVRLFPNPANDVLTLDLSNYKNQNVEVYFYNYFGHLKWVKKIDKVTDALLEMPVSNIETGNYQVRIQSKHRRAVTQPVIIAH